MLLASEVVKLSEVAPSSQNLLPGEDKREGVGKVTSQQPNSRGGRNRRAEWCMMWSQHIFSQNLPFFGPFETGDLVAVKLLY